MNRLSLLGLSFVCCQGMAQALVTDPATVAPDGCVPIHSRPGARAGAPQEWWTVGRSYRATFHDGFVFHPLLGEGSADVAMRWTTESITAGGRPIGCIEVPATHRRTAWRYEYGHAGVTEAYDVRAEGVEQSFVVHARPTHCGDIVVTGRLSGLVASVVAPGAHTALSLRDARGVTVASYGAAVAIDAAGRRLPIATACDGTNVTLTVPGAWVADAAFPLTIDPLTSRVQLATTGLQSAISDFMAADIACDEESSTGNVMYAFSAPAGTGLSGVSAIVCNHDFSNPRTVFSDLGNGIRRRPKVAFVGGADRWVVAYEKSDINGAGIAVYFHDKGNIVQNSGVLSFRASPVGTTEWFVDVGGTAGGSTGDHALLVYQTEVGTTFTPNSIVWGTLLNARTRTIGGAFRISSASGNLDSQSVAVNQVSDGGAASWIVVYEQRDNAVTNDDYDVLAARVTSTGTLAGTVQVGPDGGPPRHKVLPDVAGRGGRYMVCMSHADLTSPGQQQLVVERFDWSESSATPVRHGIKVCAPTTDVPSSATIAFDSSTRSHWTLSYTQGGGGSARFCVRRVGATGGTTEVAFSSPTTSASPYGTAVAYLAAQGEFAIATLEYLFSGINVAQLLYGQRLQYPADALSVPYGTACGTGAIAAPRPFAGHGLFTISLTGRPAGTSCVLMLGTGPGAVPLDVFQMPGCFLNLDPAQIVVSIPTAVVGTAASITLPLFDDPLFVGDLFAQWAFVQPGLNAANLGTTRGLRIQVR